MAAVAASLALTSSSMAQTPDRLPDLDQALPGNLGVEKVFLRGRPAFRLGFSSATENRGLGPLTVHGFRPSRSSEHMQVDQLVRRADGSSRLVRHVGDMRYVVNPDHRHWHFVGFARYELRPARGRAGQVRYDRKTGFCLGDRYRVRGARSLPALQPFPIQGDTCGLKRPGLRGLFAGISVGWGDRYAAHLEGQYVDVTTAPPGRYVLVHTANPDTTFHESDYSNNSSSVLLSLRWRRSRGPVVQILRRCPQSADCRARRTRGKKSIHNARRPDGPFL